MASYNTHAPLTIGPEWHPAPYSMLLDAATDAIITELLSTATETIDSLSLYEEAKVIPGGFGNHAAYVAEVFPAAGPVTDATAVAYYYPNASPASVTGSFGAGLPKNQAGSTTVANLYLSVDEDPITESDYVDIPWGGSVSFEFATAGVLAGKRILSVEVEARAGLAAASSSIKGNVSLDASGTPLNFGPMAAAFYVGSTVATDNVVGPTEVNPGSSNNLWMIADLQNMDTAAMRLVISNNDDVAAARWLRIYRLRLKVTYCTETRLAQGAIIDSSLPAALNWAPIGLSTPAKVDNWAKASGTTYVVVFRRAIGSYYTGSLTAAYLESLFGGMPNGARSYDEAVLSALGNVTALGDAGGRGYSLLATRSDAAISVDSQPYENISDYPPSVAGTLDQEVSAATNAQVYKTIKALVKRVDLGINSTLGATLRRRSDNVVMATATAITAADYVAAPDAGGGRKLITFDLGAGATLAAATQYYVRFQVSAVSGGSEWGVCALTGSGSGNAANYTGTTDQMTTEAGVDVPANDLAVTVGSIPTTLAGVSATPTDVALTVGTSCPSALAGCMLSSYQTVVVDWTSSALSANFAYYEVQRMDPRTDWKVIAIIPVEATSVFTDHEARRNLLSSYRVRVVRTDGAESAWSTTVTATPVLTGYGYIFTSNESPLLTVAYPDIQESGTPPRDFGFPDADELVTGRMYGRDFFVTFRPTERRGSRFSRRLMLNAGATPAREGAVEVSKAIRDLSLAALSYVCVLDDEGNRFMGTINVPDAVGEGQGNLVFANVTFVETTDTPSQPAA